MMLNEYNRRTKNTFKALYNLEIHIKMPHR